MSGIKGKNTRPEIAFRKALRANGIQGYRCNCAGVLGHPDVCFLRLKIAIFLDGEFWHGKNPKALDLSLKTHRDYWLRKIQRNAERDIAVTDGLKAQGWIVLRFWEKDLETGMADAVSAVKRAIRARRLEAAFRPLSK